MSPNFAVEVRPKKADPFGDYDFTVLITHNGYQWTAIGMDADEMSKVIEAMQNVLSPRA
jgi:hypothetical protein